MDLGILLTMIALGAIVIAIVVAVVARRWLAGRNGVDPRAAGPRDRSLEDPEWERRRQRAVDASGIVDTPREGRYDNIVSMARQLYGADAAIFSVIDQDREWHKAMDGTDVVDRSRDTSFCSVTIRDNGPFVVGDASRDDRFADQSVVTKGVARFYAGYPVTVDGEPIGALCVFGRDPRAEERVDPSMLKNLASLIEAELRLDALEGKQR